MEESNLTEATESEVQINTDQLYVTQDSDGQIIFVVHPDQQFTNNDNSQVVYIQAPEGITTADLQVIPNETSEVLQTTVTPESESVVATTDTNNSELSTEFLTESKDVVENQLIDIKDTEIAETKEVGEKNNEKTIEGQPAVVSSVDNTKVIANPAQISSVKGKINSEQTKSENSPCANSHSKKQADEHKKIIREKKVAQPVKCPSGVDRSITSAIQKNNKLEETDKPSLSTNSDSSSNVIPFTKQSNLLDSSTVNEETKLIQENKVDGENVSKEKTETIQNESNHLSSTPSDSNSNSEIMKEPYKDISQTSPSKLVETVKDQPEEKAEQVLNQVGNKGKQVSPSQTMESEKPNHIKESELMKNNTKKLGKTTSDVKSSDHKDPIILTPSKNKEFLSKPMPVSGPFVLHEDDFDMDDEDENAKKFLPQPADNSAKLYNTIESKNNSSPAKSESLKSNGSLQYNIFDKIQTEISGRINKSVADSIEKEASQANLTNVDTPNKKEASSATNVTDSANGDENKNSSCRRSQRQKRPPEKFEDLEDAHVKKKSKTSESFEPEPTLLEKRRKNEIKRKIGKSPCKMYIRYQQSPPPNQSSFYRCDACHFNTSRLDNIVRHHKEHLKERNQPTSPGYEVYKQDIEQNVNSSEIDTSTSKINNLNNKKY